MKPGPATDLALLEHARRGRDTLADHPDLEHEDILAVLHFAARLAHTKRIDLLAA